MCPWVTAPVHLPVRPLQVANGRLLGPAVVTADRRRGLDHRLILHGRPRVLAVSQVLALEPVEPVVPVGRTRGALVVVRRRRSRAVVLGDDRVQHSGRTPAGMVRTSRRAHQGLAGLVDVDVSTRTGKSGVRSEEHTSELQSLMRISYAVFCLKKKNTQTNAADQS